MMLKEALPTVLKMLSLAVPEMILSMAARVLILSTVVPDNDSVQSGSHEDYINGGAGDDLLVGDLVDFGDLDNNLDNNIIEDGFEDVIDGGTDADGLDTDVLIEASTQTRLTGEPAPDDEDSANVEITVDEGNTADIDGVAPLDDPLTMLIPPPDDGTD